MFGTMSMLLWNGFACSVFIQCGFILAGIVSTTDASSVTIESTSMMSSSSPSGDEESPSIFDHMAKLLADSNDDDRTTSTFDQMNEASTVATSESDSENDESTTIVSIDKSDAVAKTSGQEDQSRNIETTVRNSNVNDTTMGLKSISTEASATTQEDVKSTVKSSTTTTSSPSNPSKVGDRSRVVAKIDIESIRGRALNITGNERRPSMPSMPGGGLIYVTAPPNPASFNAPAMAMGKSAKSQIFSDDLSDVSMDNDGMDLHSSEHMAMMKMMTTKVSPMKAATTTTSAPAIHDPLCQSKVGLIEN